MVFVVRDEVDIVEAMLDYHAAQGVDAFVVCDHGSSDGTSEVLECAAQRHEILVLERRDPAFRQAEWMTEMARLARDRLGADWLLLSDADEFWMSGEKTLQEVAADATQAVIHCPRWNMLPSRAAVRRQRYCFYDNVWRVARPFPPHPASSDPREPLAWPLMWRRLPAKVFCRARGLRRVARGNHSVEHDAPGCAEGPIDILHFPVRDYASFARQTEGHGRASWASPDPSRSSWHQRRLYALWQRGELRAWYERMLTEVDGDRRSASPRLQRDERIRKLWACGRAPIRSDSEGRQRRILVEPGRNPCQHLASG